MSFSDILKLVFITYAPVIIFLFSAVLSIYRNVNKKKKKEEDVYINKKNNRQRKEFNKNNSKDALENIKRVSKSNDFSSLSKSIENLFDNNKKLKKDKAAKTKAKKNKEQDLINVLKEVNKKSDEIITQKNLSDNKTLNEIITDDKTYLNNKEDDFLDFDTEKVADIFVYKEIFDKPLSLR